MNIEMSKECNKFFDFFRDYYTVIRFNIKVLSVKCKH